MREKKIEQALVRAVSNRGGRAIKLVSPNDNGMPDRLVLLPGGKMAFAELKAPGEKPRALQLRRHEQLMKLGFKVYVIDDKDQIEKIITEIGGDAL